MTALVPPQTAIERSRNVRQWCRFTWTFVRRTRTRSRRLREHARELRRVSQECLARSSPWRVPLRAENPTARGPKS